MTTCARPGCGKPLDPKATGRPGRYCSTTCRVAALRAERRQRTASERVRDEHLPTPLQRNPYGRDFGDGDACPQDPGHGRLYFMKPAMTTQWCPSSGHRGWPFYQRDGVTPTSRQAADGPESHVAGLAGARTQPLGEAPGSASWSSRPADRERPFHRREEDLPAQPLAPA